MRVFYKETNKEYDVMQYKFRATDDFKKFVGIKSYTESIINSIGMENGEEKTTSCASIRFYNHIGNELLMEDGDWYGKCSSDDFSSDVIITNSEFEDGMVNVISDDSEGEGAEKEKMMEKLKDSRHEFINSAIMLVSNIQYLMSSYCNIGFPSEKIKNLFEEADKHRIYLSRNLREILDLEEENDD